MSGKATGWVLRNGPTSRGHCVVLTAIADKADVHGENARIGWQAIVERSKYSRRRVASLLADLIADGWLEVTEGGGPGRGRVTVYRLPGAAAALAGKGATVAPEKVQPATLKGATSDMEKVQPDAPLAEVIPLLSLDNGKTQTVSKTSPHSADAHSLCELLANRIAQRQDGARPEISPRWLDQMRLLIERGPLHREHTEPMTPDKIRNTIDFIFDHMAEPEGRGSFCWADQIRSAYALRDHWDQMKRAAQNKVRARRSPTAAILDRMSPGAGSNPLPVHLLPQATTRRAIR